jgi:hypothetical protein
MKHPVALALAKSLQLGMAALPSPMRADALDGMPVRTH